MSKTGKPVLDALIAASEPLNEEVIRLLPIKLLRISNVPGQRHPTAKDVTELAASMKAGGQITPAIVREDPKQKGSYEIAAGARRFVAAQSLGWKTLACVVRELDDDNFELKLLVENLQRLDPDPCEEVKVVERLIKRGIKSTAEISAHVGKSEHWAERRIRILHVIPKIRALWENEDHGRGYYDSPQFAHFTLDMMEFIGSLPVPTQEQLVKQGSYWITNSKTRKELERQFDRNLRCRLDQAPFDLKDPATFVGGCGPGCACDSSKQANLFDFESSGARCLNPSCFKARTAKAQSAQLEKIEKEHGKKLPVVSKDPSGEIELSDKRRIHPTWERDITPKPTKQNTIKAIVLKDGKFDVGYVPKAIAARVPAGGSVEDKSKSKSLTEKKSALQARRWNLVHGELLKALDASAHKDCIETVEDVVAIFGLSYMAYYTDSTRCWRELDERKRKGFPVSEYETDPTFHRLHKKGKGFDKDRRAALWNGLKPVFKRVMSGWYRVGDIHKAVPAMRRVAKLISFPIDERKRAADLTIKVPKTWGSGLDAHTLEPIKIRRKKS
jgi:ParB/RepB/Spo0J family partition protein